MSESLKVAPARPKVPPQRGRPPREQDGFTGTLEPHQASGVDWLLSRPKAVLADEVGLGKTITALALLDRLDQRGLLPAIGRPLCRVLWLTEPNLIEQTRSEAEKFLPGFTVLTGNDPELGTGVTAQKRRASKFPEGVDLLILSHDTGHSRRLWLEAYQPSMLVVDEAIKGDTGAFKTIRSVAQSTPRVLSMTATPLENSPMELWRLLAATDTADLWPQQQFENEFVTWRLSAPDQWGRQRKIATGWNPWATASVKNFLCEYLLKRTPAEVGLKLPIKVYREPVWVPLTAAQQAAYKKAQDNQSGFHKKNKAGLGVGLEAPLVDAFARELKSLGTEQAVVYCETLDMLDQAASRLDELGITFGRIQGEDTSKKRAVAVQAHREGEVQVLLGSNVVERGLNLQHCRVLISLDSSWNPGRESQREGRLCRIGSTHDTYEHAILLPDTDLVRAKQGILDRKRAMAEAVGL